MAKLTDVAGPIDGIICTKCGEPKVSIMVFGDGDCITDCAACGIQMPEHLSLPTTINVMLNEVRNECLREVRELADTVLRTDVDTLRRNGRGEVAKGVSRARLLLSDALDKLEGGKP